MVAGFEFTKTTSYPSSFSAKQACVLHSQTACPIMIGPEPITMIFLMSVRFGISFAPSMHPLIP